MSKIKVDSHEVVNDKRVRKREYSKPTLRRYGSLGKLTGTGPEGTAEGGFGFQFDTGLAG